MTMAMTMTTSYRTSYNAWSQPTVRLLAPDIAFKNNPNLHFTNHLQFIGHLDTKIFAPKREFLGLFVNFSGL